MHAAFGMTLGLLFLHPPTPCAGQGALADALGALSSSNPAGLGAFVESLRTDVSMGASLFAQFGGDLSAALTNLGVPPVDGPSSAVAQRKRANRGTRLSDIIKVSETRNPAWHWVFAAVAWACHVAQQAVQGHHPRPVVPKL